MANRIAEIRELSPDELMLLEAADIEFEGLPADVSLDTADEGPWRFRVACPRCSHVSSAPGSFLGQKVRCPKCQHDFAAEWGEPVEMNIPSE